jgi:hypothetical protein
MRANRSPSAATGFRAAHWRQAVVGHRLSGQSLRIDSVRVSAQDLGSRPPVGPRIQPMSRQTKRRASPGSVQPSQDSTRTACSIIQCRLPSLPLFSKCGMQAACKRARARLPAFFRILKIRCRIDESQRRKTLPCVEPKDVAPIRICAGGAGQPAPAAIRFSPPPGISYGPSPAAQNYRPSREGKTGILPGVPGCAL